MKKDRKWWDNEARLKALCKGHNSPFNIKNERLAEIVKELQGASNMESPLDQKGSNSSNSKELNDRKFFLPFTINPLSSVTFFNATKSSFLSILMTLTGVF